MIFKVNDKLKCIAPCANKKWRYVIVEVGKGQIKVRRTNDKNGKDVYWVLTDYMVIV